MGELISGAPHSGDGSSVRTRIRLSWLFYGLLVLFLGAVFAFIIFRPILVLPRITLGPGYALTDQDGNRLTNEDLRGKLVLYQITHTSCQPPCRQTDRTMREVQARLGELETGGIPVELVTISLDPDHDTQPVLRAHAESLSADLERWHFVTGPTDRLKQIVGGGFGVYFDWKEDGRLVYDPALMLVDGVGILRAEYIAGDPGADRILRDMDLVLEEIEKSEGANKVAYEAAHLFMCYPR